MKKYALLMALLGMLCGTEARAANISFDVLDGVYSGHIDSSAGVRVSTASNWLAEEGAVGNTGTQPGQPQIVVDSNIRDARGRLTEYLFTSVDLSSNLGTTTFIINGKDDVSGNAKNVFFFGVTLDHTSARISNIFPSNTNVCTNNLDCQIQRLFIAVVPDSTSSYRIDNICMSGGPCPTFSFSLPTDVNNTPVIGSIPLEAVPPVLVNVPEPASLLLLGAGLAGIGIWRRKARR